jgi:hypothetical protein
MKNVTQMTTSEMLDEYNGLTGRSTTKFSSRAAGEKALLKARDENAITKEEHMEAQEQAKALSEMTDEEILAAAAAIAEKEGEVTVEEAAIEDKAAELKSKAAKKEPKPKKEKVAKVAKAPVSDEERKANIAAGTKKSWEDPAIKAARAGRSSVDVFGKDGVKLGHYKSTRAAFEELGLDQKHHIKFRGELRKLGELEWQKDGEHLRFVVAVAEEVGAKSAEPEASSEETSGAQEQVA